MRRSRKKPKLTKPQSGTFIGQYGRREVYIPDNAKHIFVCGTTGSGKTVALSNFIKNAVDNDIPALIIDGKGDMGEGSLLDIVQRLNQGQKKVYVINLADPAHSAKYNPFLGASSAMATDMLINMTYWSEEHYKLNAERYIQRILQLLELGQISLSFRKIVKCMKPEKFTDLSSYLLQRGLISKEEHIDNLDLLKSSGKISQSSVARFSTIAESQAGKILSDKGINIAQALTYIIEFTERLKTAFIIAESVGRDVRAFPITQKPTKGLLHGQFLNIAGDKQFLHNIPLSTIMCIQAGEEKLLRFTHTIPQKSYEKSCGSPCHNPCSACLCRAKRKVDKLLDIQGLVHFFNEWRRAWDSNPRDGLAVYTISSRAPSTNSDNSPCLKHYTKLGEKMQALFFERCQHAGCQTQQLTRTSWASSLVQAIGCTMGILLGSIIYTPEAASICDKIHMLNHGFCALVSGLSRKDKHMPCMNFIYFNTKAVVKYSSNFIQGIAIAISIFTRYSLFQ